MSAIVIFVLSISCWNPIAANCLAARRSLGSQLMPAVGFTLVKPVRTTCRRVTWLPTPPSSTPVHVLLPFAENRSNTRVPPPSESLRGWQLPRQQHRQPLLARAGLKSTRQFNHYRRVARSPRLALTDALTLALDEER